MPDLSKALEHLAELHDHICPRQILGVRMGMIAAQLLNLELPQENKRLFTFVETDGCFADGVMVSTGCSLGHRTLHLMDYGKVAATFIDTKTMQAFRIAPHPLARTRAAEYVPHAKSRWHAQLAAYQIMPSDELLQIREVSLTLSLSAIISRPGVRVTCVRCGEEILNEREIMRDGQSYCHSCANMGYWLDAGVLSLPIVCQQETSPVL